MPKIIKENERELTSKEIACLKHLTPIHCECLKLFHTDKLSYIEIATKFDVPEGTIRSRLSRARHNLNNLVEGTAIKFRKGKTPENGTLNVYEKTLERLKLYCEKNHIITRSFISEKIDAIMDDVEKQDALAEKYSGVLNDPKVIKALVAAQKRKEIKC